MERKRVLAGQNFLLPRLDLLLPRRRERLHDTVDERASVLVRVRDSFCGDGNGSGGVQSAGSRGAIAIVPQGKDALVLVLLALLDDRKLRHFRGRLRVNVDLNLSAVSSLDC
jgi:hypothetical protein